VWEPATATRGIAFEYDQRSYASAAHPASEEVNYDRDRKREVEMVEGESQDSAAVDVAKYALIKFGAQPHLEELVHDGSLFMRRASYFAPLENHGNVRQDGWEGQD